MLILIARVLHGTGMETLTFHTPRPGLTPAELADTTGPPRCIPGGPVLEVWGPLGTFPSSWRVRGAVPQADVEALKWLPGVTVYAHPAIVVSGHAIP